MNFNNYKFTKKILKKCVNKITNEKLKIDLEININKKNFYETKICINIFEKLKKEYGIYNDLTIFSIYENLKSNLEEFELFKNIKFENNNICFEPTDEFFSYLIYKNFLYEFYQIQKKKDNKENIFEVINNNQFKGLNKENFSDEIKEDFLSFNKENILSEENKENKINNEKNLIEEILDIKNTRKLFSKKNIDSENKFFDKDANFDFNDNMNENDFLKIVKKFEKNNKEILDEKYEEEEIYFFSDGKGRIKNIYLKFFKNIICENKNKILIENIKNDNFEKKIIKAKKILEKLKINFEFYQKKDKLYIIFKNKEKVLIYKKNQLSQFLKILLNLEKNNFQNKKVIFLDFSNFEKTDYFLKNIGDFQFINLGDVFFDDKLILNDFEKKFKFIFFLIFFFDLKNTKFFNLKIFKNLNIDLNFEKLELKKSNYLENKDFSFFYNKDIFLYLLKSKNYLEKFFLDNDEKDLKNFFLMVLEILKIYEDIENESYLDEIIYNNVIKIFENI